MLKAFIILIPILQRKKLWQRDTKELAKDHGVSQQYYKVKI